ncbi:hypothetical protein JNL27_15690 [bacterium]|nr:hypothetical protein [bacterium]
MPLTSKPAVGFVFPKIDGALSYYLRGRFHDYGHWNRAALAQSLFSCDRGIMGNSIDWVIQIDSKNFSWGFL